MPEIDWDIKPGWGGTSRLARFTGRRLAKEIDLIGALFNGERAKEYRFVNRVVKTSEELDQQVGALTEVMPAKHPRTVRRTKFIMDKGADLHILGALAFEVPIMPYVTGSKGLKHFTTAEGRKKRRALSKDFWQD